MLAIGNIVAPEGARIEVRDKRTQELVSLMDVDDKPITNPFITSHAGTQSSIKTELEGIFTVSVYSHNGLFLTSYEVFSVEASTQPTYLPESDFDAFADADDEDSQINQPLPIEQGGTGADTSVAGWNNLLVNFPSHEFRSWIDVPDNPLPQRGAVPGNDCNNATQRGYYRHESSATLLNAPYENFGKGLIRVIPIYNAVLQTISKGVDSMAGRFGISGHWGRHFTPGGVDHGWKVLG